MAELVDPETECLKLKKAINENHKLAQKAGGEAVERAALAGELLKKWKELLPRGVFEEFVDTHFEGSLRTAQLYMQAEKRLTEMPKAQRIALLESSNLSITGLISAKGKPGGTRSSSPQSPPRSGPATGEAAGASQDYGTCPNCQGKKWDADEFGVSCSKCHHPHGEPVGNADEGKLGTQRAKTVKTIEALMRAFYDLNRMAARAEHAEAIASCKSLLTTAKGWK